MVSPCDVRKSDAKVRSQRGNGRRIGQGQLGTSLIELIVVISDLVTLASMSIPIYTRARARAARVDCISRTGILAHTGIMICPDNEGRYPCEGNEVSCAAEPSTVRQLALYLGGRAGLDRLKACPSSALGDRQDYVVMASRIDPRRCGYLLYGNKTLSMNDSHHWYRHDPGQFGFVDDQWGATRFYQLRWKSASCGALQRRTT